MIMRRTLNAILLPVVLVLVMAGGLQQRAMAGQEQATFVVS